MRAFANARSVMRHGPGIDPKPVSCGSAKPAQRVLFAIEGRSELLNVEPSASEIPCQLAIRRQILLPATWKHEFRGIRELLSNMLEQRALGLEQGFDLLPFDTLPPNLKYPAFMLLAKWNELEEVHGRLSVSTPMSMDLDGESWLQQQYDSVKSACSRNCDYEILRKLAGTSRTKHSCTPRTSPRSHWEPFTEVDMRALAVALPPIDFAGDIPRRGGNRPNSRFLPNLLARISWLTGMRSVEMFSYRIMIASQQTVYSRQIQQELGNYILD